jgi:hypothetical protein
MKACRQIISSAAAIKVTQDETLTFTSSCLYQFADDVRDGLLMPGVSNLHDTVAMVRFFELCVQLSQHSEDVYIAVSKKPM